MMNLSDFQSVLRVERSGPPIIDPGEFVTLKITPSLSDLRVTQLVLRDVQLNGLIEPTGGDVTQATTGTITFTPQAPAQIDLQGLAGTLTQTLAGQLTFPVAIPGQVNLSTQSPQAPASQTLTGTIDLPQDAPVAAGVSWLVLDEWGNELSEEQFLAPEGLNASSLSILFVPPIVELRQDDPLPAPRKYRIRCQVTLSAMGDTQTFSLPEVPVLVPFIAVPTVLALFPKPNFMPERGALLVVVPEHSPFREAGELLRLINKLQGIMARLTAIPRFALFVLGLQRLAAAIQPPRLRFKVADEIDNLNQIKLADIDVSYVRYHGADIFDVGDAGNDMEAEDEMSSLMLLGLPGRRAECYNRREFKPGQGQMNVTTGADMFVALSDLKSPDPVPPPLDDPLHQGNPGVTIAAEPSDPDKAFNNELSSIAFRWASPVIISPPRPLPGPLPSPPGRTPPGAPRLPR